MMTFKMIFVVIYRNWLFKSSSYMVLQRSIYYHSALKKVYNWNYIEPWSLICYYESMTKLTEMLFSSKPDISLTDKYNVHTFKVIESIEKKFGYQNTSIIYSQTLSSSPKTFCVNKLSSSIQGWKLNNVH